MLVNALFKYYSGEVDFWESITHKRNPRFQQVVQAGDLHFCEFYRHCGQIPCTDPRTNFQKLHDFDLTVPNVVGRRYIIQYRHPFNSLISFYYWWLQLGETQKRPLEDTRDAWEDFLGEPPRWRENLRKWREKEISLRRCMKSSLKHHLRRLRRWGYPHRLLHWKRFMQKWVIANANPNTHYLCYEEVVHDPEQKLAETVSFMSPGEAVDRDLIERIVGKLDIRERRRYVDFAHYDRGYFRILERDLAPELSFLRERHGSVMELGPVGSR
jgi:hypothetical protein